MHTLAQDLRFALRRLRKNLGFTLTAILTLALGIGATTAIYSIVQGTLLAPLPYPHADELVGIGLSGATAPPNSSQTGETADFLAAHATSFAQVGIADDSSLGANLSVHGAARAVHSLRVSASYLPTLGVSPLLGRTFTPQDDLPGASRTALLSESLWRSTLDADPNIIGRVIHINGDPVTVIGVLPATTAITDPDVWQPLHLSTADPGYQGDNYQMIARLKPGHSIGQASSELSSLTQAIYRQSPVFLKWYGPGVPPPGEHVWPLQQVVVSGAHSSLLALSAAVLAVLLMACLNLAGLMTARALTRRGEIALRLALGAGRTALLRLLLTESLVLAIAGSLLGLVFARMAVPLLLAASPIDLPRLAPVAVDLRAAAFALLTGCATTLFFGLVPALGILRVKLAAQIGTARTAGDTLPQQRLGKTLLIAQVALATTLLSVGALLLNTFLHLRAIPSGVRTEHLYTLQVNLKGDAYASAQHTQQFIAQVEERLSHIPGVEKVATINGLPLDRGLNARGGAAGHPDQIKIAELRYVTPGYLRTAGTPLLIGNDFSPADTATSPPVALVSELAAKRWFPGRSALGEYAITGGSAPLRVVGVVANVRNRSLADATGPMVYLPYAQTSDDTIKMINGWFPTTFVLRTVDRGTTRDPEIAAAAAKAVNAVDPDVPASKFAPMQSFVDHSIAAPRFFSWLAGSFAVFALLLTAMGLFGLLSYQIATRTREFGVRMALGARRIQVLSLVLRGGLMLTGTGLLLGVAGSFVLRHLLVGFVSDTVQVAPASADTLLGNRALAISIAAVAMLISAVAACLLPATRAASVNPTEALRTE